jgi:hypothetical protein
VSADDWLTSPPKLLPVVTGTHATARAARRARVYRFAQAIREGFTIADIARKAGTSRGRVNQDMQNACPAFIPDPRDLPPPMPVVQKVAPPAVVVVAPEMADDDARPWWSRPGPQLLECAREGRREIEAAWQRGNARVAP